MGVSGQLAKCSGVTSLLDSSSWVRTAPTPIGLPSMKMEVGFFGSKYLKVVLVDNAAFRRSKDNYSSCVHCHLAPSQVNCRKGLVIKVHLNPKYFFRLNK